MIAALVFLAAVAVLYLFGSEGAWLDELLSRGSILFVLAIFPAVFFYNLLRAPAEMHDDLEVRLLRLEGMHKPSFSVEFEEDHVIEHLPRGTSLMTAAGTFHTNVGMLETVLRVLVRNTSASESITARAYLVGVFEHSEAGELLDIGYRESQLLSWSRDWKPRHKPEVTTPQEFERQIPPGDGSAFFYVVKQFGSSEAVLMTKADLLENRHPLQKGKKHRLVVQIVADGVSPVQVAFDVSFAETGLLTARFVETAEVNPIGRIRRIPTVGIDRVVNSIVDLSARSAQRSRQSPQGTGA